MTLIYLMNYAGVDAQSCLINDTDILIEDFLPFSCSSTRNISGNDKTELFKFLTMLANSTYENFEKIEYFEVADVRILFCENNGEFGYDNVRKFRIAKI